MINTHALFTLTFVRFSWSWTALDVGAARALACNKRRAVALVRGCIKALPINAIVTPTSPPSLFGDL